MRCSRLAFVRNLTQRYLQTGSVEPKLHGSKAIAKLIVEPLPMVKALVEAQPDALLEELSERFTEKTGVQVSVSTMQRAVTSLEKLVIFKQLLRSAKARTPESLNQALTQIINDCISSNDALSWFAHLKVVVRPRWSAEFSR